MLLPFARRIDDGKIPAGDLVEMFLELSSGKLEVFVGIRRDDDVGKGLPAVSESQRPAQHATRHAPRKKQKRRANDDADAANDPSPTQCYCRLSHDRYYSIRGWGGTAVLNECKLVANNTFVNAALTAGAISVYNETDNLSTTMFYFVSNQTDNTPAVRLTLVMSGVTAEASYDSGKNFINNIFTNYVKTAIVKKSDTVISTMVGKSELLINANETCYCMIPADVTDYVENISYNILSTNAGASAPENSLTFDDLDAPIEEGAVIGTVNYLLKDGSVHSVSIVAGNSVHSDYKAINFFYKIIQENTDIFLLISVLIIIEISLLIGFIINKLRKA